MTTPSVFELIRRYDLDPKRSLAQNFLTDETHLARIVAAAELTSADTVLEIGPGLGTLTAHLARRAGRVVAVELDDRLLPILHERFADQPPVTFVHGDILDLTPDALVTDDQRWIPDDQSPVSSLRSLVSTSQQPAANSQQPLYKVVANLPYYITSAVLRHLLEAEHPPQCIVVLVQKEVAQRICAEPGDMSLLAVSVQFYAQPQMIHTIPAGAFYPRPQVDSAVLRLDVRAEPVVPEADPTLFFRLVRAGFSQKRKQLLNSLSSGMRTPKSEIAELLEQAGIDPRRRAQTLSLAEWGIIYRCIHAPRTLVSTSPNA